MQQRTRLSGGPAGTASWVYFETDGTLVVEFYDHGAESERLFGNDVALLIRIASTELWRLRNELMGGEVGRLGMEGPVVLAALARRFACAFEVKTWLDEVGIAYEKQFEPWA